MPHQRILLNLKAHSAGDGITDWLQKWLTDRSQRVIVDGEVSNWKTVLIGVPQRSVLGPLLFLIYTNDLDDNITTCIGYIQFTCPVSKHLHFPKFNNDSQFSDHLTNLSRSSFFVNVAYQQF